MPDSTVTYAGESGWPAPTTGEYRFAGYADGGFEPVPLEMEVFLGAGEELPMLDNGRRCRWHLVGDHIANDETKRRPQCQPR